MASGHALVNVPALLWRLVSLSHHRLLVFDLDGTLAPFDPDRDRVSIVPETLELLQQIGGCPDQEMAFISGRPLHEVARLTAGLVATRFGEHGWERASLNGDVHRHKVAGEAERALALAERRAIEAGLEAMLERKRASRVLHTRALATSRAREVEAMISQLWKPLTLTGSVRLDEIHGGLELRSLGANKGSAIRELRAGLDPPPLTVYVGDDTTDEDAFEAVRESGFGVRVGAPKQGTLAQGWLDGVQDVPHFLREWLRLTAAVR